MWSRYIGRSQKDDEIVGAKDTRQRRWMWRTYSLLRGVSPRIRQSLLLKRSLGGKNSRAISLSRKMLWTGKWTRFVEKLVAVENGRIRNSNGCSLETKFAKIRRILGWFFEKGALAGRNHVTFAKKTRWSLTRSLNERKANKKTWPKTTWRNCKIIWIVKGYWCYKHGKGSFDGFK